MANLADWEAHTGPVTLGEMRDVQAAQKGDAAATIRWLASRFKQSEEAVAALTMTEAGELVVRLNEALDIMNMMLALERERDA